MTDHDNGRIERGRQTVRELRALAQVTAPPTLLPAVLQQVGLIDRYAVVETPLGPLFVAFNARGVAAVARAETPVAFEHWFAAQIGRPIAPAIALPPALQRQLQRQIAGERNALTFDLRTLSAFEQAVLRKALEIPRGEVRPYAWVAREIGRPAAVRAVGTALAHNPIPLLIPCHRVVRSDGHIGQYSLGGPTAKAAVLRAEGVEPERLEQLAGAGVRYLGSDSTGIYCLPTCRAARRITEQHRHTFRSDREAQGAGYRPCQLCRPAAEAS